MRSRLLIAWSLAFSSLGVISVKLLNDTRGILDDLLVSFFSVLGERLDDTADAHLFQGPATLFVNAEVADREESDATR